MLNLKAIVYTSLKIKAPITVPIIRKPILLLLINVLPIRSDASATVTIPEPMSILTDFCDWASRQPDNAVNALDTHKPTIVVITGLTEEDRTISGLFPVALMARPIFVFKNRYKNAATMTVATPDITSFSNPVRFVEILEKEVE